MPWMIDEYGLTAMNAVYSQKIGQELATWWQDERLLLAWWKMQGYSMKANKDYMRSLPISPGHVAWVVLLSSNADGQLWNVVAYSDDKLGGPVARISEITVPIAQKNGKLTQKLDPDYFFTQWMAKKLYAVPQSPAQIGDRCGCAVRGSRSGKIGKVCEINEHGRIMKVVTFEGGLPEPAGAYADKWFPITGRDEAFDFFWKRGQTTFPHYMTMRGMLAHKQKKLTAKGDRKPVSPPPSQVAAAGAGKRQAQSPEPLTPLQIEREEYRQRVSECLGKNVSLDEAMSHRFMAADHPCHKPYEFYEAWRGGIEK